MVPFVKRKTARQFFCSFSLFSGRPLENSKNNRSKVPAVLDESNLLRAVKRNFFWVRQKSFTDIPKKKTEKSKKNLVVDIIRHVDHLSIENQLTHQTTHINYNTTLLLVFYHSFSRNIDQLILKTNYVLFSDQIMFLSINMTWFTIFNL